MSNNRRRIAIVGAGAIGGTVAGHLAYAGEDVLVVDANRDLTRAISEHGLVTRTPDTEFVTHPAAVPLDELAEELDIVLLAVKSPNTDAAVRAIRGHLRPDSFVVSLQNGLNEPTIADLVGADRTVGAFLNFGAAAEGLGRTRLQAAGAFYVGELSGQRTDRVVELAERLSVFLPVKVTGNVMGYLWSKLALVALLDTACTTDRSLVETLDEHRLLAADLVTDVCEVAAAESVILETFEVGASVFDPSVFHPRTSRNWDGVNACIDVTRAWQASLSPDPHPGVWVDIVKKGIPSEIDAYSGPVIRFGEKHDLGVPRHRLLVTLVHEIERGQRQMDAANVELLERVPSVPR